MERRNLLRTVGAGAAVGSVGLFSTGAAATNVDGVAISPEDHEPPNPDVQVQKVDKSVKEISAHYPLLTLPEHTVIEYIDGSDLSRKEKADARKSLAELRQKFPVKKEKDGNTTWLTLARDNVEKTEDDGEKFDVAQGAFAKGAGGRSDRVSTTQWGGIHRKMTRDACNEMGLSSSNTDELASYSDDPDNPDVQLGVPDGIPHHDQVENGLEKGLNEILHHVGQYYDENAYEVWHNDHHSDSFGGLGGAPFAADWHMDRAGWYSGSTQNKYLGKATHYPQDMGVPLHTGMGWEQINLNIYYDIWCACVKWNIDPMYWLHSEFEEYFADNWTGGHYLKWEYGSTDCSGDYCYYPISDVSDSMVNLAGYTGQYSYDVYHKILDAGDTDWTNWSSSKKDWMQDITENCVSETGLYVRGFIEEEY